MKRRSMWYTGARWFEWVDKRPTLVPSLRNGLSAYFATITTSRRYQQAKLMKLFTNRKDIVRGHPPTPKPPTILLPNGEPGALARDDIRAYTPVAPRAPEPMIRQDVQS